jgi:hypothetical protein
LAAITEDDNFGNVLASYVQIASFETSSVCILGTNTLLNGHIRLGKSSPIDHQTLAAQWRISPDCAKKTILNTNQRGIRTCLNLMLSCCFPTNDLMLRYKRLPHTTFTDTMFAVSVSRQGNKAAQVFAMSF